MKIQNKHKQLKFDWPVAPMAAATPATPEPAPHTHSAGDAVPSDSLTATFHTSRHPGLVQVLPWDFCTSFPEPLEEAIEAGKLQEEDREPENLKALHDEHARHALVLLSDLDAILDARRRHVDPGTGRTPRTESQKNALEKQLQEEPARLEHAFDVLMDVYEEAFGPEAVDALRKAIRAWHAGVEVISETAPVMPPLPEAVERGVFGNEESGEVVRPEIEEITAITEAVAEQLEESEIGDGRDALVRKYAEDFGDDAAAALDKWARAKSEIGDSEMSETSDYDPGHPWHYYAEGDNAEPIPVEQIEPAEISLSHLSVQLPKSPLKKREKLRAMLGEASGQLTRDQERYRDLITKGIEALSDYDRNIAHGGNDDLAWASALALKFNHIRFSAGRVRLLSELLK